MDGALPLMAPVGNVFESDEPQFWRESLHTTEVVHHPSVGLPRGRPKLPVLQHLPTCLPLASVGG
eukprot:12185817-Alexandrium_andersonii.AAC.1